jgi:hypothetical protein
MSEIKDPRVLNLARKWNYDRTGTPIIIVEDFITWLYEQGYRIDGIGRVDKMREMFEQHELHKMEDEFRKKRGT